MLVDIEALNHVFTPLTIIPYGELASSLSAPNKGPLFIYE